MKEALRKHDGTRDPAGAGPRATGWWRCLQAACATFFCVCLRAESTDSQSMNFGNMSIEELMKVKLSLSRTDESYAQSPAAAYIITAEDIRRSGATSIPEALRGVPGLEVARVDPHTWAITARGFNDTFANKLLVMIDGRTVYTPLFSGVFWDVEDTLLEDIEHIEIIRGPGSTLWGANAVNGVINIVTRTAAQTQGTLVTGGAGTGETVFGSVRHGGKITDEAHYRVYVKYFDREDTSLRNGGHAGAWEMVQGGFRTDWTPGWDGGDASAQHDLFTLQGDIYVGQVDQAFSAAVFDPTPRSVNVHDTQRMDGGNLLGRWTHPFSDESSLRVQTYYDRTRRRLVIFEEERDTFDIDAQHRFKLGERHEFVWGAGYRLTHDNTKPTATVALVPSSRTLNLFSAFVQDEITVLQDRLGVTFGSKLEHNDFTGWEVQPGTRLLWTPATNHTVWASVTRAVRTPSRAENDVRVTAVVAPGAAAALLGDSGLQSETVIAYELGYRVQPTRHVSFDIATFYNDYENLHTVEFVVPPGGYFAAQRLNDRMHGRTYGLELGANWDVTEWWRLRGSYTAFNMDLEVESSSNNPANDALENASPNHQFMLRSSIDLPKAWEFDLALRYVDSLSLPDISNPAPTTLRVPSYFSLDARLAWRPRENLEIAIVGQNLLDHRHAEFKPTTIRSPAAEVERSVYGKVTWRF